MTWIPIAFAGLLVLVLLACLFTGFMIAWSIFHPQCLSLVETRAVEDEKSPGLMQEYDRWALERYDVSSRFGYRIRTYYLPADVDTNRFVVMAHGYTYTHHGCVKYASMMHRMGFNVLMYDERYHGDSGGKNCTMGYFEQTDLSDMITHVVERFGSDLFLGTLGESMGAATVLLEQARDERVRFVIADCPFADLDNLVAYLIKQRLKLPRWPFVPLAGLYFRWFTKAVMADVSPLRAVKEATVPILYMHGEEDAFIPPENSRILFEATPSAKALHVWGNHSKHADSARQNPAEYEQALLDFLSVTFSTTTDEVKS